MQPHYTNTETHTSYSHTRKREGEDNVGDIYTMSTMKAARQGGAVAILLARCVALPRPLLCNCVKLIVNCCRSALLYYNAPSLSAACCLLYLAATHGWPVLYAAVCFVCGCLCRLFDKLHLMAAAN